MEPVDHLILLGQSAAAARVFNRKPALDASTLAGRLQILPSSDIRFQSARSSAGSVKFVEKIGALAPERLFNQDILLDSQRFDQ
jgi:hypothetical protein